MPLLTEPSNTQSMPLAKYRAYLGNDTDFLESLDDWLGTEIENDGETVTTALRADHGDGPFYGFITEHPDGRCTASFNGRDTVANGYTWVECHRNLIAWVHSRTA